MTSIQIDDYISYIANNAVPYWSKYIACKTFGKYKFAKYLTYECDFNMPLFQIYESQTQSYLVMLLLNW